MTKKRSRILAAAMLALGICFLAYAFSHPEASFPWGNGISYCIYAVYVLAMLLLFIAPFKEKGGGSGKKEKKPRPAVSGRIPGEGEALWLETGNILLLCGLGWLILAAFIGAICIGTQQSFTGVLVLIIVALCHLALGAGLRIAVKSSERFRALVNKDMDSFKKKYRYK